MGRIPIAKIPVPAFKEDKWVTLSNDNLSLMQLLDVDIDFLTSSKKEDSNFDNILRAGGIYALGRDKVEGVEFDNIYFKVYSIVNEYKGVNLDSVIVKEVSIDENGNVSKVSMLYKDEEIKEYYENDEYNFCIEKIFNSLKSLKFDIIKDKGKPISENIYIQIWQKENGKLENWTH